MEDDAGWLGILNVCLWSRPDPQHETVTDSLSVGLEDAPAVARRYSQPVNWWSGNVQASRARLKAVNFQHTIRAGSLETSIQTGLYVHAVPPIHTIRQ